MKFGTKHKTVTDESLVKISTDYIGNHNLKRMKRLIINMLPCMLVSEHAKERYEKRELFFNKNTYRELKQGNFRIVELTLAKNTKDCRVLVELTKTYEMNHGQKVYIYYVFSIKNFALVTGYINKVEIGRKNTKKYNKSIDKVFKQVYYNSIKKKEIEENEKSRMVHW